MSKWGLAEGMLVWLLCELDMVGSTAGSTILSMTIHSYSAFVTSLQQEQDTSSNISSVTNWTMHTASTF